MRKHQSTGAIVRHHFRPVEQNPGALPSWDPLWPASMRLDCNSQTDRNFAAGLDVTDAAVGGRTRPRRWYRVIVSGAPLPRPVPSGWLAVTLDDLKRRGKSGVARLCKAPVRPAEAVHLDNGGKGRCGERGAMTTKLGAATCPKCVVDGRPA